MMPIHIVSLLLFATKLSLIITSTVESKQHVIPISVRPDRHDNPRLRHRRDNQCPDGYQGPNCAQDIDECKSPVYPCTGGNKRGSFCVDYDPPVKYKCGCLPGYDAVLPNASDVHDNVTIEWRPLKCIPRDVCVEFVCHEDATCIVSSNNTAVCICKDDLVGDGITNCKPPAKVEVSKPPPGAPLSCRMDSDCIKLENSDCVMGLCECNAGFYRSNGKGQCISENQCADGYPNDCHKNAICTSTEGSYTCTCKDGYHDVDPNHKPGTMCAQTNECLDPSMNNCNPETEVCVDLPPPSKWECVMRPPSLTTTTAPAPGPGPGPGTLPPPMAICPDSEAAFALACSPRLADVTCMYGRFCCQGNGKCVPDRSCSCDGSSYYCQDSDIALDCPSVCPKTLQWWKPCNIDHRYRCNYGDPIVCNDPAYSSDFDMHCQCYGGDFQCTKSNPCPVPCPVTPPVHGDSCSASFVNSYCRYGDPFVCKTGERFEYEKECECYNGKIYCSSTECPVPCPTTQPDYGDACSTPFTNSNTCDYGKLCCGDETDGACIPDKACYCDGSNTYCYDKYGTLPCTSVCPKEPPQMGDACDIDSRYQCNYGDPVVCEDPNYSSDFELQCQCYGGIFHCFKANACPVSCPVTPPVDGDACSATFIDWNCRYGDPFVCESGESFEYEKECACIHDDEIYCHSNACPVPCPATPPVHGASCSGSFVGWWCTYGDLFVCDSGESFEYEKACSCSTSEIYCYSNVCPVPCPEIPPVHGDSCSASFVDSYCRYGDPFVCDSGESFDYEKECTCSDGAIYCFSNECSVPCPATQPSNGDACSTPFINSNTCDYGKLCCGDETDGACIPDKTCYCSGSATYCYDKYGTLPCTSVCPKEPPQMWDACDIDSRYRCNYGDPIVCEDPNYSSDFELQCQCDGGNFYCSKANACPVSCPVTPPVHGASCSASFIDSYCQYGDPFVCNSGESFKYEKQCECAIDEIFCSSNVCPVPCPEIPLVHGDSCSASFIDSYCRYGDPFVCKTGESFEYEKKCECSFGEIRCYSNVCPTPCPLTQPGNDDVCSTPFTNSNSCDYGKFCCGDETDGKCIPDKTCYCDGSNTYCHDKDGFLPCKSVCPKEPPLQYAACNIDSRYQCNYGDPVLCDDPNFASDFELQCLCRGGNFECTFHQCPVPCPVTPPVPGDFCSAPFVDGGYCGYGDPVICDWGGSYEHEKQCFCSSHEIYCYNHC